MGDESIALELADGEVSIPLRDGADPALELVEPWLRSPSRRSPAHSLVADAVEQLSTDRTRGMGVWARDPGDGTTPVDGEPECASSNWLNYHLSCRNQQAPPALAASVR